MVIVFETMIYKLRYINILFEIHNESNNLVKV